MKITTRSRVKTLLLAGRRTSRFDRGKYKWTGSMKDYADMEVPDYEGIEAVFADYRKDKHGPYVVLMTVHK